MPTPSPIRILDGGLGTTLEDKYGARFSSATSPLWSSHLLVSDRDSECLLQCQADFCRAGIDVLETATYQVSAAGFARTRLPPDWPNGVIGSAAIAPFLERAVAVAEKAVAAAAAASAPTPRPAVALSLGPYGACMIPSTEYSGAYDEPGRGANALRQWHTDRLHLFAGVPKLAERIDYAAFETVPRLDEIVAVRQLFRDPPHGLDSPPRFTKVPYWISCVFSGGDDNGAHATLSDGTSVERAVEAMLSAKTGEAPSRLPWGIGINCTKISKLPRLIERYEAAISDMICAGKLSAWPALVLYPDGTNGEVYNTTTQQWERPNGETAPTVSWETQLSSIVRNTANRRKWREILVGGCCRTTDSDIRALKHALHVSQP